MRRRIPLIITFIIGVVLITGYFVTRGPFNTLYESFSDYFAIITVFAFILGGGSLLKIHLKRVSSRAADWPYSVVTLVAFLVTRGIGLCQVGIRGGMGGEILG
ncbi:MAG: hypothetical protein F4104_10150, partial [Gemmatimonadetes bacterium]|nr:hypothetical protein [Gemmatimonadota bacterium]